MSLSIVGIVIGLVLIMLLVYKRISIIAASLIAGIVVALFSQLNVIEALTSNWAVSFANFFKSNFLIFALSALFGKIMEDTGAAAAFAKVIYRLLGNKYAVYVCMLATGIMVYGGISAFVVIFTVYPIFMSVMKQADIPRRFVPALIFGTTCTWSSCMLPGSIATQNLIPTNYLPTTAMAAPIVGIACGLVTMVLTVIYFNHRFAQAKKNGEHFETTPQIEGLIKSLEEDKIQKRWLSIIPMAVMLIALNVFKLHAIYALLIGCVLCAAMFWKNLENKLSTLNVGLANTGDAIINTSAAVAFGGIVQGVSGFGTLVNAMIGLGGSPLISFGLGTTILAGVCGSGAGGLGIAMQSLVPRYLEMGVNPEILHRVATVACIGLDSLPHCGLVVTMISYCGLTYKESYRDIFVVSVIITLIALVVAIALGSALYPI